MEGEVRRKEEGKKNSVASCFWLLQSPSEDSISVTYCYIGHRYLLFCTYHVISMEYQLIHERFFVQSAM